MPWANGRGVYIVGCCRYTARPVAISYGIPWWPMATPGGKVEPYPYGDPYVGEGCDGGENTVCRDGGIDEWTASEVSVFAAGCST